jgi:uncharacterized protein (TIGR03067 family)
MRSALVSMILAVAIPHSAELRGSEKKPADDPLDGEWEIVGMVYKGKVQKFSGPNCGTIKIEGRKLVFKFVNGSAEGVEHEIVLRPAKEPKEIDLRMVGGKDDSARGIYEVKDGVLTITHTQYGEDRPNVLDATKNPKWTSFTLRRLKK